MYTQLWLPTAARTIPTLRVSLQKASRTEKKCRKKRLTTTKTIKKIPKTYRSSLEMSVGNRVVLWNERRRELFRHPLQRSQRPTIMRHLAYGTRLHSQLNPQATCTHSLPTDQGFQNLSKRRRDRPGTDPSFNISRSATSHSTANTECTS